jgi:mRNA-degrading endonuclease YafQ of YafQ-DinJ toxin-antitoxin module
MTFDELDEFKKDLKKLLKKYRSMNDDLNIIRKVLKMEQKESPPFSFRIDFQ